MPTTNPEATTFHRSLLASGALASLGGALASCMPTPAPAAEVGADAELLALCAEYVALDRAFCANGRAGADMLSTDPAWKALNNKGCAMVPRLHELEELIADTTPRTHAGLVAKAEAAHRSLVSDADAEEGGSLLATDSYLACTVIENLLGLTGGQA